MVRATHSLRRIKVSGGFFRQLSDSDQFCKRPYWFAGPAYRLSPAKCAREIYIEAEQALLSHQSRIVGNHLRLLASCVDGARSLRNRDLG